MKLLRKIGRLLNGSFLPKAATLLLLAEVARAGIFTVNFVPVGISYDSTNQLVSVASGTGGVTTYTTNGTQQAVFGIASGIFDLGSGMSGNVWVGAGTSYRKYTFTGTLLAGFPIPNDIVGVGRELTIGGTNWVLYAVNGGNVVAYNLNNDSTITLMPTPANVTGADWILRPGGYAIDHVCIGLNTADTAYLYDAAGNGLGSVALNSIYGVGQDMSFGDGEIWVAQSRATSGRAVSYAYTVPLVPEATVSAGWTNGQWALTWSGRWLESSTNLTNWSAMTNAANPHLPAATATPQFFRAVK